MTDTAVENVQTQKESGSTPQQADEKRKITISDKYTIALVIQWDILPDSIFVESDRWVNFVFTSNEQISDIMNALAIGKPVTVRDCDAMVLIAAIQKVDGMIHNALRSHRNSKKADISVQNKAGK